MLLSIYILGVNSITDLYADNLPRLKAIHVDTFANLPNLRRLSLRDNVNLMTIDREAFGINQTLEEVSEIEKDVFVSRMPINGSPVGVHLEPTPSKTVMIFKQTE